MCLSANFVQKDTCINLIELINSLEVLISAQTKTKTRSSIFAVQNINRVDFFEHSH